MTKKLYKIENGKMLCGVCTGLAEYLKLDVNVVRILWIALTLCASIGLWLYIACAILLPWKDQHIVDAEDNHETEN